MLVLIELFKIGSATTLIGDPTGRKSTKKILSESEIFINAGKISKQIDRIYTKGMELTRSKDFIPIRFVDNLAWFKNLKLIDFLTDLGRNVKVNSMLARNW